VDLAVRRTVQVVGRPDPAPGEERHAYVVSATPDYFRTAGIPLLRGRTFRDTDHAGSRPVAVINERLRKRLWPGEDPIGRRLTLEGSDVPIEIVGVVGDVLHEALDRGSRPELFVSHGQSGAGAMTFFVRTESDPAALLPGLQETIWRLEPSQSFYQVGLVESFIQRTLAPRRFGVALAASFAGVAVLLAALGVYGAISFSVTRRTREVGIRMALGARGSQILTLILRQAFFLAATGVAIGLALSLLASGLLSSLLFGVGPRDAVSLAGASVCLLLLALAASYLPARRAVRVGPAQALRTE
jgi:putative ABC transport system permease protein